MVTKAGLYGVGFVGEALKLAFENQGLKVLAYDPRFPNLNTPQEAANNDFVFVCGPTLPNKDGSVNTNIIYQICDQIWEINDKALIIIKSTIPPSFFSRFTNEFRQKLLMNPEFLTERTAKEDFENQKHIVIGGDQANLLKKFYESIGFNCPYSLMNLEEACLVKYGCNVFYSLKLSFFNELKKVCDKAGSNFETVKDAMLKNGWINPKHTQLPGPDGKFGWGGHCFTKDTIGYVRYCQSIGVDPNTVLGAIFTNMWIRGEDYEWTRSE